MDRRVVVTGLGVVAPNGIGKKDFLKSLVNGVSGISILERIDTTDFKTKMGGEVKSFPLPKGFEKKLKRLARFAQFAIVTSFEAIEDSGLIIAAENREQIGIAVGTAACGTDTVEAETRKNCSTAKGNPIAVVAGSPASVPIGILSELFGVEGPSAVLATGCAAGSNAITYAYDQIKFGRAEIMICGGTEAPLTPLMVSGFGKLGHSSSRNTDPQHASRPFDRLRDGFVLSEGSGMVVLEEFEHAKKRGANIYGEIKGYGFSNDLKGLFESDHTGSGASRAIKRAMSDAKLNASDVNYINAHGSSSCWTDIKETLAIKAALGSCSYSVPISSIKSLVGHPLGASGGWQMVSVMLSLKNNITLPTFNYQESDPQCDLDYVPNEPREHSFKNALINAFGIGGINISIAVGAI